MNFKKIIPALLIAMSTAVVTPVLAETPVTKTETPAADARSQQLENRLMEIKKMDKSQLTSQERRELRKEVKHIREERRHNGIYLSIGAIIIIALLLIILL